MAAAARRGARGPAVDGDGTAPAQAAARGSSGAAIDSGASFAKGTSAAPPAGQEVLHTVSAAVW